MNHVHLCLSDLLDQDLTAWEYFQTLPSSIRQELYDCEITTFDELQAQANERKRGNSHAEGQPAR
ncbi:MAG: hypothetical protein J6L72_01615 [Butyricicoccus sp.]|nr:hypothetical protein [Butyricicoccus sp.]